jgi:hypothetical protein
MLTPKVRAFSKVAKEVYIREFGTRHLGIFRI